MQFKLVSKKIDVEIACNGCTKKYCSFNNIKKMRVLMNLIEQKNSEY
jgi:hypothetical protein